MQDYGDYVQALVESYNAAVQLGPIERRMPVPQPVPGAPAVLIFSPHPDDEVIVGALPLRLLKQCGVRVINVAVTLGSNKARQTARQEELLKACAYLGFESITADECGLEKINLLERRDNPVRWLRAADILGNILRQTRPLALFYPHASDANTTHMGVHGLVNHALLRLGGDFSCHTVETEFWSPMDTPNLMVESTPEDVAELVSALAWHEGEVERNPYHLTLPAWMMDNVRRGNERVGGQGGAGSGFRFATLYRVRQWQGGRFENVPWANRFLASGANPLEVLGLTKEG